MEFSIKVPHPPTPINGKNSKMKNDLHDMKQNLYEFAVSHQTMILVEESPLHQNLKIGLF